MWRNDNPKIRNRINSMAMNSLTLLVGGLCQSRCSNGLSRAGGLRITKNDRSLRGYGFRRCFWFLWHGVVLPKIIVTEKIGERVIYV
jgi:hypothetical protein